MAVQASIGKALCGLKFSATSAAVTGTGAITTGLRSILAGSAHVTCYNSATSATMDVPQISSISGGTVNAVVALLTYTGPTIALESGAKNINCTAWGN